LLDRGAVTAAHDSGVGFFDTAPWYGRGVSERRLGVALSQFPRDTFHLQSKVGRYIVPAPGEHPCHAKIV